MLEEVNRASAWIAEQRCRPAGPASDSAYYLKELAERACRAADGDDCYIGEEAFKVACHLMGVDVTDGRVGLVLGGGGSREAASSDEPTVVLCGPLDVVCPHCEARPGDECSSDAAVWVHTQRLTAWLEAQALL